LQVIFDGQCGGLLFSLAAQASYLALKFLLFLLQFSVDGLRAFLAKVFPVGNSESLYKMAVFTNAK